MHYNQPYGSGKVRRLQEIFTFSVEFATLVFHPRRKADDKTTTTMVEGAAHGECGGLDVVPALDGILTMNPSFSRTPPLPEKGGNFCLAAVEIGAMGGSGKIFDTFSIRRTRHPITKARLSQAQKSLQEKIIGAVPSHAAALFLLRQRFRF